MRARTALLALALSLPALRARADEALAIDLTGCPAFDEAGARAAIAAELPQTRAPADRVTVVVACGADDASVAVTSERSGVTVRKRLAFGELVGEQRVRLVALVVAELVALVPTPDVPPPNTNAAHAPSVPRPAPAPPAPPAPPGLSFSHRRSLLLSDVNPDSTRYFLRGGARSFLDRPGAFFDLAAGAGMGPLALDAFLAERSTDDALGSVRGMALGLGVAATLVCGGGGSTWVCLSGRAAAGLARAEATPVVMQIGARDANAAYFEAGPRLEVRLEGGGWSGELALTAAWSSGLSAFSGEREVLRLAGPLVGASFTLGFAP